MQALKIIVVLAAGLTLAGCSKQKSLYMEPGKPEHAQPGHGKSLPPAPPKTERQ